MSINEMLNSLPRDLQIFIGKIVHFEHLKAVHFEFKTLFKIGVSMMITKNGDYGERRRKKIFAFLELGDVDELTHRSKFYEIARDVIDVPQVKGWERTPYNYRNISTHFDNEMLRDVNPRTLCIRNGVKNVGVLPSRYFYSKPINSRRYRKIISDVEQFIQMVPISASIRGGKL